MATSKYAEIIDKGVIEHVAFHATLEGVTGFLMHNRDVMQHQEAAKQEAGGARGKKFIPAPDQEAEWGAYRFPNGDLYMPALSIQRSMIEAAKGFKDPARPRASAMRQVAAGLLTPPGVEGYTLTNPDGEPITEYEIDIRRAVVQRNAVMRARGLVQAPWYCEVTMLVDAFVLPPETALKVLMVAGQQIGVGDYRPEKSGPFGRFRVTAFTVDGDN